MRAMQMDKVADYYLSEWAKWRWTGNGAARGHRSDRSFDGSRARNPTISDPAALLVDAAVSQVCREDESTGRALCFPYLDRLAPHQIAERLRLSHQAVAGAVRRWWRWIRWGIAGRVRPCCARRWDRQKVSALCPARTKLSLALGPSITGIA